MYKQKLKTCLVALCSIVLVSCSTTKPPMRPDTQSYLNQAQRLFKANRYRDAKRILLPLACEGIPKAEYALGYMYYYGFGVATDKDVGIFWIKRAAAKKYKPAVSALRTLSTK